MQDQHGTEWRDLAIKMVLAVLGIALSYLFASASGKLTSVQHQLAEVNSVTASNANRIGILGEQFGFLHRQFQGEAQELRERILYLERRAERVDRQRGQ